MDRRGFLRNILGSLAAVCLPITAAKPRAALDREIEFRCTDLVGDFHIPREFLCDPYFDLEAYLTKIFSDSMNWQNQYELITRDGWQG